MTLERRIDNIADAIGRIHARLVAVGYEFARPAAALPGPEPGVDRDIARIERETGPLPLAIKLFWRRVGSVDFCGGHPAWTRRQCADALLVYPPSEAIAELEDFLGNRAERIRCNFPYAVPIAPDAYTKDGISGGMWYGLSVPAVADDPPLNHEPTETTFCGYLEFAVRWGGFPGLEGDVTHTWPLDYLAGRAERTA